MTGSELYLIPRQSKEPDYVLSIGSDCCKIYEGVTTFRTHIAIFEIPYLEKLQAVFCLQMQTLFKSPFHFPALSKQ